MSWEGYNKTRRKTMKYTATRREEFLTESNAIEGVYDGESLRNARKAWNYLMNQDALSLSVVLNTHAILMEGDKAWDDPTLRKDYAGRFRDGNVYVGSMRMPPPALIAPNIQMRFCFETMRANPAPDWKELHILYERIHPFFDGNGRTGRMFMNWTRLKRCDLPLLIIKKSEVGDYYRWFRN